MSHYETLGVARDASPDEVKQAFRRRSSQAHPDKGGTDAEMAAINRAYECLGDPERRAAYDRSGTDAKPIPVEEEARQALVQLFSGAIEHSTWDMIADVSQMLGLHAEQLRKAQNAARQRRERLVKRTGKVRVKHGENLVQMLIDGQIAQLDAQILHMDRGLEVNRVAGVMLKAYEQDDEGQRDQQMTAFASFINQAGAWTSR